jgi:hypothetical protein
MGGKIETMYTPENVIPLIEEYQTILNENNTTSKDIIVNALVRECEWSTPAAEHLHRLVKDNGAFMLRNALALSIALRVEDGELGF